MEYFWTCLEGIYIIIDNKYKLLIIFHGADVHLNEPIIIDELTKLANQLIQKRIVIEMAKITTIIIFVSKE